MSPYLVGEQSESQCPSPENVEFFNLKTGYFGVFLGAKFSTKAVKITH